MYFTYVATDGRVHFGLSIAEHIKVKNLGHFKKFLKMYEEASK